MLWHLWIGRARHPGPSLNNLDVRGVFYLWVIEPWWLCLGFTDASFLALLEHRLVPPGLAVRVPGFGVLVCLLFGPLLVRILVMLVTLAWVLSASEARLFLFLLLPLPPLLALILRAELLDVVCRPALIWLVVVDGDPRRCL